MNDYILELKKVSKSFPGVKALNDVSINVKPGEVYAIVGENGAGKSTLMKVLSGAHASGSYSGEIVVNSQSKRFLTPRDSEEAGIEMVYQEISLILDMTAADNIFLGKYPRKRNGLVDFSKLHKDTKEQLDVIGLDIDPFTTVRRLNTSQQQMLSIARGVSRKPKVLVLDEPTSALTETESNRLFKAIDKLKASNTAIIYISHKMDEVFNIADRIAVMRDGELISVYNKEEFDRKTVIDEMVGRELNREFPQKIKDIGEDILTIKNISVRHRFIKDKRIVDSASLTLKKGEILGIAGLVGAGRSELASAMFGHLKKEKGYEIRISEKNVQINNTIDAINNGIAMVTEDRKRSGIISMLSVKENIMVVALKRIFNNFLVRRKKEKTIAEKYVKLLSIKTPSIETKIRTLSGGNQQKVVLSKWLLNEPKILILDEPTRGIDVGSKYEIYNIMMDLANKGIGIIMISSEMEELLGVCDRCLVMAQGKIVGEFTKEEVSNKIIMQCIAQNTV